MSPWIVPLPVSEKLHSGRPEPETEPLTASETSCPSSCQEPVPVIVKAPQTAEKSPAMYVAVWFVIFH